MKTLCLSLGLAALAWCGVSAKETLSVKVEPEQTCYVAGVAQEVVIKIDLTAGPATGKRLRSPLNLAVVLDRSGSMAGAKIEKAKQAAAALLDQLTGGDVFSLVVYDSEVQVLIPAQTIEDKEMIKNRIFRIRPGGSTALYGGVERGAEQLLNFFSEKRINRVILLSDGLANMGPSSTEELKSLGRRLSEKGVAVTTVGLGEDYNEDLMAGLAESSDANYYYVKDAETLPEIFRKELGYLLAVTAQDVEIEITVAPGFEPIGFIGRPEIFRDHRAVVRFGPFSAQQNRYLLLRGRLEDKAEKSARELATIQVRYRDEANRAQNVKRVSAVALTRDEKAARASVNRTVQAQRELMWNAVAKDEALAEADAGNYANAKNKLAGQARRLGEAVAHAPAEYKASLEKEAENLRQRADEVEQGALSKSSRKQLQAESYQQRNTK